MKFEKLDKDRLNNVDGYRSNKDFKRVVMEKINELVDAVNELETNMDIMNDHETCQKGYVYLNHRMDQLEKDKKEEELDDDTKKALNLMAEQAICGEFGKQLNKAIEERIAQEAAKPSEPELLPCPFCGGSGSLEYRNDAYLSGWAVLCGEENSDEFNCVVNVKTCTYSVKAKAIKAWNTRNG